MKKMNRFDTTLFASMFAATALLIGFQNCGPAGGTSANSASSNQPSSGLPANMNNTSSATGGNNGSPSPAATPDGLSAAPSLVGQWAGSCFRAGSYYVSANLTFTSGSYTATSVIYSDSQCTSNLGSINVVSVYVIPGAAPSPAGAWSINSSVTQATATPANRNAVFYLNQVAFCGVSNWTVGQATDVTGKNCDGFSVANNYNIYAVTGSTFS